MNRLTGEAAEGRFTCRAGSVTASLPAGTREVFFRPEDLRLCEDEDALRGTLSAAFFLGDRTRLFVDVGEERPLMLDSTARLDFQRGQTLHLGLDPRGLLVL